MPLCPPVGRRVTKSSLWSFFFVCVTDNADRYWYSKISQWTHKYGKVPFVFLWPIPFSIPFLSRFLAFPALFHCCTYVSRGSLSLSRHSLSLSLSRLSLSLSLVSLSLSSLSLSRHTHTHTLSSFSLYLSPWEGSPLMSKKETVINLCSIHLCHCSEPSDIPFPQVRPDNFF